MRAPLHDITWQSTGVSVLWDAPALRQIGPLSRALTLREFFRWAGEDFGESSPNARFMDEPRRRCVAVAGLEAALDVQEPQAADDWLQASLQPAVRDFQSAIADGGNGAALIFWMVNVDRFREDLAEDAVKWECTGQYRNHRLRFSHGLWNGAQRDLQRINPRGHAQPERGIGFYLQRIS